MKIVLDTNVLISSLLNPNGNPAKILNLILSLKIILLFDNRIINEYYNVLKREKFQFSDEDDKKFYEVFISSTDYLVTGNINHFPKEKLIVKPVVFINQFL